MYYKGKRFLVLNIFLLKILRVVSSEQLIFIITYARHIGVKIVIYLYIKVFIVNTILRLCFYSIYETIKMYLFL